MTKSDSRHTQLRESATRLIAGTYEGGSAVWWAEHVVRLIDESNARHDEISRLHEAARTVVNVPAASRIPGFIYDADSGVCIGPASHEERNAHKPGEVYKENRMNCNHKLVIAP